MILVRNLALPLAGCCYLGEHHPRCIPHRLLLADLHRSLMPPGRYIEVAPASQPPQRREYNLHISQLFML